MFLIYDFNRLWAPASEKPTISSLCSLGNRLRAFLIGCYPLRHLRLHSLHSHSSRHSIFAWATQFEPSHNRHSLFWPLFRTRELRHGMYSPWSRSSVLVYTHSPTESFVTRTRPLPRHSFSSYLFSPRSVLATESFVLATERTCHGVVRSRHTRTRQGVVCLGCAHFFVIHTHCARLRHFATTFVFVVRPCCPRPHHIVCASSLCPHRRIFPRLLLRIHTFATGYPRRHPYVVCALAFCHAHFQPCVHPCGNLSCAC